jgi:hypothetical protein
LAKEVKNLMKLVNVRAMFKKWEGLHQNNQNKIGQLTIREDTHGFGPMLFLNCRKNHQFSIKVKETVNNSHGNNAVCNYDLNLCYTLGLQMIGVGGEHASIVAAFLDVPYPHNWKAYFPLLEQYMHSTIDAIKIESEHDATMAKIEKAMESITYPIEQLYLANDIPMHRIAASYDTGWQVSSSGGKYGSRTGHALLIGAESKKC